MTTPVRRYRGASPEPGKLTAHELAVVIELARGSTHKEIARQVGCSRNAVTRAIMRAYTRLDANTNAHLVARAVGLKLIPAGIALTDADRQVVR